MHGPAAGAALAGCMYIGMLAFIRATGTRDGVSVLGHVVCEIFPPLGSASMVLLSATSGLTASMGKSLKCYSIVCDVLPVSLTNYQLINHFLRCICWFAS